MVYLLQVNPLEHSCIAVNNEVIFVNYKVLDNKYSITVIISPGILCVLLGLEDTDKISLLSLHF